MRFLEWPASVFELHEIQFKIQDSKEEIIWLPNVGSMPMSQAGADRSSGWTVPPRLHVVAWDDMIS